jgi:hypothetical protein
LAVANKAVGDDPIILELAGYRDGASRGFGFEIGKEVTRCGFALGINAEEYR